MKKSSNPTTTAAATGLMVLRAAACFLCPSDPLGLFQVLNTNAAVAASIVQNGHITASSLRVHFLSEDTVQCDAPSFSRSGSLPDYRNSFMHGFAVSNLFVSNIIQWDGQASCVPGGATAQAASAASGTCAKTGLSATPEGAQSSPAARDSQAAIREKESEIRWLRSQLEELAKRAKQLELLADSANGRCANANDAAPSVKM